MDATLLNNPVERRKAVRLKTRPDLQISEQRYEGKVYHVVKDPVCLRYYRFNRQEYFVFSLFDGTHTMEDIKKRFEDEYKPHRLEYHDLEGFARQLVTAGLVQHEAAGTGKHLFERRAKQRRMKRIATFTSILYIKIPVFDPDRILSWMYQYLWWIFTWPFFILSMMLMAAAALHVTLHFQTFYDKLPSYHEFFAFRTMLYLWLSLGVVKVIHEFGHGLSCKAFGGECHEMGFLLMCLSPCLYANVTDAWTVASKWKRIIISFAGIYVELIIASISTFVWWYTPHLPEVNNIALCLMTLCSVSTFLFNANPLMRFDGYYMMADWLEIPNLRDRSNKFVTNLFLEKCLGIETPQEAYMAPGRKALFIVYAIAAYVYRWVITFSIIWMLSDFFGPKLKVISQMIAIMALVSMFVWPGYRMVRNIRQRGRLPDMKAKRVYVTLAVLAGMLTAFFLLPLPISRVREKGLVSLNPDYSQPAVLAEPAILDSLYAEEGQTVRQGQLIARFISPALQQDLQQTEARAKQYRQVAEDLERRIREPRDLPTAALANLMTEQADNLGRAQEAMDKLEQLQKQSELLWEVKAPIDGVIMGLPRRNDVGKLFERTFTDTRPVCMVGDPKKIIVKLPVSANDYRLLREDLAAAGGELMVSMHVKGRTDRDYHGVVRRLPDSDAKQVPIALTQRGGGPIAVKAAGDGGQETTPIAQTYIVEIELIDPDGSIRPGALVSTKIHCQWRSAAWWLKRFIVTAMDVGLY